jgi:hypothetical protein
MKPRAERAPAKRSALVELIPRHGGRDLIHNPQSTTWLFDGMEEGAILNFNMSKESIKNVIDLIRNANISNEQRTDLSGYDLSKGVAVNLELTSKFILDFIEIEINSGKNIGTNENTFLCEPLIINPMELKYENTTTPLGQEGNFVKVHYEKIFTTNIFSKPLPSIHSTE